MLRELSENYKRISENPKVILILKQSLDKIRIVWDSRKYCLVFCDNSKFYEDSLRILWCLSELWEFLSDHQKFSEILWRNFDYLRISLLNCIQHCYRHKKRLLKQKICFLLWDSVVTVVDLVGLVYVTLIIGMSGWTEKSNWGVLDPSRRWPPASKRITTQLVLQTRISDVTYFEYIVKFCFFSIKKN